MPVSIILSVSLRVTSFCTRGSDIRPKPSWVWRADTHWVGSCCPRSSAVGKLSEVEWSACPKTFILLPLKCSTKNCQCLVNRVVVLIPIVSNHGIFLVHPERAYFFQVTPQQSATSRIF